MVLPRSLQQIWRPCAVLAADEHYAATRTAVSGRALLLSPNPRSTIMTSPQAQHSRHCTWGNPSRSGRLARSRRLARRLHLGHIGLRLRSVGLNISLSASHGFRTARSFEVNASSQRHHEQEARNGERGGIGCKHPAGHFSGYRLHFRDAASKTGRRGRRSTRMSGIQRDMERSLRGDRLPTP